MVQAKCLSARGRRNARWAMSMMRWDYITKLAYKFTKTAYAHHKTVNLKFNSKLTVSAEA